MKQIRYTVLSPLLGGLILALVAGGCDTSAQFVQTGIPTGLWSLARLDTIGGVETRLASSLLLSDTLGIAYDTTFTRQGGNWRADSVTMTRMEFQPVGDGYQRALEIQQSGGGAADTTVHYWYFFKRGDLLYYYMGMRFPGLNPGLAGVWKNDPRDSIAMGGMTTIDFGSSSVTLTTQGGSQYITTTKTYKTSGDTLRFDGLATPFGDRYELVPSFALYITSHAGGGFAPEP